MDALLIVLLITLGAFFLSEADGLEDRSLVIILSIWIALLGWGITMAATSKAVSHEIIYPVQTLEQNGHKYQVYLNDEGYAHNVTRKFNRLFPEGSVIKDIRLQNWHLGCYCIIQGRGIEVWTPNEDGEMVKFPTERKND